jgi:hypothetical protein
MADIELDGTAAIDAIIAALSSKDVEVDDLTATGNVTIDKASAALNVDSDTGTSGSIIYSRNGVNNWKILTSGGSPNRLIIQALNKTTGAFVSNIFDLDSDLNTISLSGAASVAVPAATAATHAAQVSAITSSTGQLQIGGIEMGDTGWRGVVVFDSSGTFSVGSLGTGWIPRTGVAGYIRIRRQGGTVFAHFSSIQADGADPTGNLYTAISGFKPVADIYTPLSMGSTGFTMNLQATLSGIIKRHVTPVASGQIVYGGLVSWPTDEAWPTSLPGSAV